MSQKLSVLFVCLGNICRSPAAEGFFLHLMQKNDVDPASIRVDSAATGTWHIGKPPDPRMQAAASSRGVHLPSRGRQLETRDYTTFDYIIAMDENNYTTICERKPAEVTATILRMRDFISSKEIEGIPDPYFGGDDGFEEVLDLLDEGCSALLKRLREVS